MNVTPRLRGFWPVLRSPNVLLAVACGASLLWAYWGTFVGLAETWASVPYYSHGFLIPAFAAVMLWMRRHYFRAELAQPSAWGLAWLAVGGNIRLLGAAFYLPWLDGISLLPSLAGLFVLLGGWHTLRVAWPTVAFLAFMLPLPFFVEGALATHLQTIATEASTYTLQTIGLPALSQGNVIVVNEAQIGVAEACNGLGMLMVFFAISSALAFVIERPLWERGVILLSAVPVALVSNVIRIATTGVLMETVGKRFALSVFHDWWGWLMMPVALLILYLEYRLISWLVAAPARAPATTTPIIPGLHAVGAAAKKSRTSARPLDKNKPKEKVP